MEIEVSQSGKNLAIPKYSNPGLSDTAVLEKAQNQDEKQETVKGITVNTDTVVNTEKLLSTDIIKAAVEELSSFAKASSRQLAFSVDESSDRPVVKVTDTESGKVIRQIPSEEVLKLSERLRDLQSDIGNAVGVLFNKQV
ncbi:flagellar protein FlaG [Paraglaciecola sp. 25GB23A]|uniref:flagellar protein FlaG n=1 Tax=Paraglaciecola sp. 25GB23A TaxID=3156068 RepID=UPI0032AF2CED